MDIKNLIEKRANLWQEAKTFLDEHTDEAGKMTAEDGKTYERMEAEIVDLKKTIERYQRQAAIDLEMNAPAGTPLLNNPQENKAEIKTVRANAKYKEAALQALRTNFKQVNNYLQEGTDGLGGYLVPAEWDERLIKGLSEENVMRQLGKKITTSGEHKINIAGTKPAAAWVDEGQTLNFNDVTFSQITLAAHKLQVGIKVTNELLYDNAFNLETYIIDEFTQAISNAEEDAFLNGAASDTGKPTGLFDTATADTSTAITTTGASIAADDIINLTHKLKRPYRKNAVFIMNDAVIAVIRKLKDNTGAFLWQPSYQQGEPDKLLGFKVYTSQFAPKIAAGNAVIAFGDMSYYNIADRGVRSFRQLNERYADNDMTAFLMIERVDGVLVKSEAVSFLKMKA